MTEIRAVARQIQQLETYLNNLVSALVRGELPVNLQPVTQIFDRTIASLPPALNLPTDRFIELYNDLPHLFNAYAIDVSLSSDSYLRQTNDIIFSRFINGNYWIIPIQALADKAWLVPNPLKNNALLERMPSLDLSFDREVSAAADRHHYLLAAPAIVQILPIVEPLTWKLVERGKLTNQQSTNTNTIVESLVQKLVKLNDRIVQIERESVKPETIKVLADKQAQLQAISTKLIELQNRDREPITASIGDSKEMTSLKIDLEKLKEELQRRQRQQDKQEKELEEKVKFLVAQELAKFQPAAAKPEVETIDAEIIVPEAVQQGSPQIGHFDNLSASRYANGRTDRMEISPFAALYNSGEKAFVRSYMFATASVMKNSSPGIKLVEDNVGHYWIIPFNASTHYLVPKMDFPDYSNCLEVLALLFDGANDRAKFLLFKPAIVTLTKSNMPKQWQLEQKGYLEPIA